MTTPTKTIFEIAGTQAYKDNMQKAADELAAELRAGRDKRIYRRQPYRDIMSASGGGVGR